MPFQTIKVQKPGDIFSLVNRIQENITDAINTIEQNKSLPAFIVKSSTSINTYLVKPSDRFLIVDSRGGPIKIVLYKPSGGTQDVFIKNAYNSNGVTITQSDGKPNGDGETVITLDPKKAMQFVNTGKEWFSFGAQS